MAKGETIKEKPQRMQRTVQVKKTTFEEVQVLVPLPGETCPICARKVPKSKSPISEKE